MALRTGTPATRCSSPRMSGRARLCGGFGQLHNIIIYDMYVCTYIYIYIYIHIHII